MRFELANHVFGYISGGSLDEKDSFVHFKYSSADLSDKDKSIVFDLAGYVFFYIFLQIEIQQKKDNQNSPEILQQYLDILAADK